MVCAPGPNNSRPRCSYVGCTLCAMPLRLESSAAGDSGDKTLLSLSINLSLSLSLSLSPSLPLSQAPFVKNDASWSLCVCFRVTPYDAPSPSARISFRRCFNTCAACSTALHSAHLQKKDRKSLSHPPTQFNNRCAKLTMLLLRKGERAARATVCEISHLCTSLHSVAHNACISSLDSSLSSPLFLFSQAAGNRGRARKMRSLRSGKPKMPRSFHSFHSLC